MKFKFGHVAPRIMSGTQLSFLVRSSERERKRWGERGEGWREREMCRENATIIKVAFSIDDNEEACFGKPVPQDLRRTSSNE